MLTSAVITLVPTEAVILPANLGRATHAWFLEQVHGLDPGLAQTLHEPNQERPFTVSNLWGPGRPGGEEASLEPGVPCFVRVTSIATELSELLEKRLLTNMPTTVCLGGAAFRVEGVTTDPREHPWAGQTTFQSLVQRHTLGPQPSRPGVALRFASPTVFRSSGVNIPLPLPGLVFESLVRRWNAFSPIQVHPEVRRFAEEGMAIARYRLRTERVAFGDEGQRGTYPGFVGTCAYTFRVRDGYWMGLVRLLGAFALYAGVGTRTTMGLGQTRMVGG